MKGHPKIRGIFRFSSTSSTMKSIGNQNLSNLIINYLIISIGFLDVFSAISNVVIVGFIYRLPIFCATVNGIMFTLEPKYMSAFPTFISNMEIENTTTIIYYSFSGGVCRISLKLYFCFISFSSSTSFPLAATTLSTSN